MKLVDFLGLHLKSDDMIDLVEAHGLEVVYDFDRAREGAPDAYHITAQATGFEIALGEDQTVRTIFCYITGEGAIAAIDMDLIGVPLMASIAEVEAAGRAMDCRFSSNEGVEFLGRVVSWAKLSFADRSWHFEFENSTLCKITLMVEASASP